MNPSPHFGYHGKILEIDLSESRIQSKTLDPRMTEEYLGGRGLATRIFMDEIDLDGCRNLLSFGKGVDIDKGIFNQ